MGGMSIREKVAVDWVYVGSGWRWGELGVAVDAQEATVQSVMAVLGWSRDGKELCKEMQHGVAGIWNIVGATMVKTGCNVGQDDRFGMVFPQCERPMGVASRWERGVCSKEECCGVRCGSAMVEERGESATKKRKGPAAR